MKSITFYECREKAFHDLRKVWKPKKQCAFVGAIHFFSTFLDLVGWAPFCIEGVGDKRGEGVGEFVDKEGQAQSNDN